MASISKKIDENITQIETMFGNWSDIVERRFDLNRCAWGDDPAIYVVYIDGLCDHELIENTLIKPITWEWRNKDTADLWEHIISCEGQTADYTQESDMDNVVRAVLRGDTAIFVSGSDQAIVVSSKHFPVRGIEESSTEGGMEKGRGTASMRTLGHPQL